MEQFVAWVLILNTYNGGTVNVTEYRSLEECRKAVVETKVFARGVPEPVPGYWRFACIPVVRGDR